LQEYNFTSEHRQGRKHNNADVLYREVFAHCHKVETSADVSQMRAIADVAAAGWDPAALRTEQLDDQDTGHILEETEAEQSPEGKDIADRSPTYKNYWAQ
jgi:hypothetical protein